MEQLGNVLRYLLLVVVIASANASVLKFQAASTSYVNHADRAKETVRSFLEKFESRNEEKSSMDDGLSAQCGYDQCDIGKEGYLNVHMVPHTHDDVGWLKTVDGYYYTGVQYILDTVIEQLHSNPQRRFIYVEIAFFSRWWHEQGDATRHMVKGLVNSGRLEFILGGWCMNDEASTHYSAIIDQHTFGFRFLKTNFGDCGRPRIGWQIDPFGHSRETASLFAQFGYDGLFFARLDYQDYAVRKNSKNLESVWLGSASLGDQASLFTGVLFNTGYGPPSGFCFECGDSPIQDDPRLEDYNVDERVHEFISVVKDQAKYYTTNHIMLTMGSDFQYGNALVNFKNMDKLIAYTNDLQQTTGSKVNVIYSTPSCYLYAVNRANNTYRHKQDDFFPYANDAHAFWTGYFTSRSALKGYERLTNNFFQVCKQLDALSLLGPEHGSEVRLRSMRDALGIVQHHDAVSGTEKQAVAFDYAKRLAHGTAECQELVNIAYSRMLPLSGNEKLGTPNFQFCTLLNVSYCTLSETNKQFVVVVYNPYGQNVSTWTRIPVVGKSFTVTDSSLRTVTSQIVPLSPQTLALPDRKGSIADNELVFLTMAPSLGFNTYFVQQSSSENAAESWLSSPMSNGDDVVIKNEYLSITFDGTTGLLSRIDNLAKSLSLDVSQNLLYYTAYAGKAWPPSGAYIFRPNDSSTHPLAGSQPVQLTVIQGSQVQEVRQVFGSWGSQVVRLYAGTNHVEFEWTVGPIPIDDNVGKEVISRFSTPLKTNATFYTDANGREVLQRIRNYRATWPLNQTEPVAGNYYPVNSRIYVQDVKKNIQLTVLTDRSLGGSSINDGQIELMLHRRLLKDDSLGVGEPLNETGIDGKGLIVRGKHYVYLDDIASSVALHRTSAQRLYMSPSLALAKLDYSPSEYVQKYRPLWSGLKSRLPDNVHLLTLEQWVAGSILMRLEHFYEKNEDPVLSQPATVHLLDLFVPFSINTVVEMTLGANEPLADATRLQWTVEDYGQTRRDMKSFVEPLNPETLVVTLKPMQIRTFQIKLNN